MSDHSGIDPKKLRQAFGKFATGVTVITTRQADGTPRGFTANSFTSVSLDPPLLLVCIGKSAASLNVFTSSTGFAVNVLSEWQKDTSGLFATQRADKFGNCEWRLGGAGLPLISGSLAWFECARHEVVDAGDHVILLGRVLDFGTEDGPPLGFFQGSYFGIGLESKLVQAIEHGAAPVIGVVYEKDGAILLAEPEPGGAVAVPSVGRDGNAASLEALRSRFAGEPLKAQIEFVYAVFEDQRTKSVTIYYRGHAEGRAPEGMRFYAFDEIPFDRMTDSAERSMLTRYVNEARSEDFAVYFGDETQGEVRTVR